MFSESSETISNILDINELKQFRKKKWTMYKSFFENIIKDQGAYYRKFLILGLNLRYDMLN